MVQPLVALFILAAATRNETCGWIRPASSRSSSTTCSVPTKERPPFPKLGGARSVSEPRALSTYLDPLRPSEFETNAALRLSAVRLSRRRRVAGGFTLNATVSCCLQSRHCWYRNRGTSVAEKTDATRRGRAFRYLFSAPHLQSCMYGAVVWAALSPGGACSVPSMHRRRGDKSTTSRDENFSRDGHQCAPPEEIRFPPAPSSSPALPSVPPCLERGSDSPTDLEILQSRVHTGKTT